jgi:hypothetical protein
MKKQLIYKNHSYDLGTLSKEDLLALKTQIDDSAAEVKQSLADARRRFIVDGEPADRQWYRRAETALRIYGQNSQAIQAEIAQRNAARREANRAATERLEELSKMGVRVRLEGTVTELASGVCRVRVGEQELSVPITIEQSECITEGMEVHLVARILPPGLQAEQCALRGQMFPERDPERIDE